MNVLPLAKRQEIDRLLLEGWSQLEVAARVGVSKVTVSRYMFILGIKRTNGHRSPKAYWHRNQCARWYQQHATKPVEFETLDDSELSNWREAKRLVDRIKLDLFDQRVLKAS